MNNNSRRPAFVALALLSLSFAAGAAARADEHPRARPAALHCRSPRANHLARDFHLTAFDTTRPETDLDAETDGDLEVDGVTTRFCANNGCDDSYCFVFFTDDLKELAAGRRPSVKGIMNYFNADSVNTDQNGDTVELTCTNQP